MNRRDAVKMIGGLFASVATAATGLTPAKPPRPAPAAPKPAGGRVHIWPRRTPEQEAAHEYEYPLMMAAVFEARDALLGAGEYLERTDPGPDLADDANGMHYHMDLYEGILRGQTFGGEEQMARDKHAAHRPHPDPIYRVLLALEGLKAAAEEVLDRHAGCDGCFLCDDCRGVAYQAGLYNSLWSRSCTTAMSEEARQENLGRLLADYEAGKPA